ncbi:MAG: hypothetical protein OXI26_00130 [bacterium]|nr:hypothetical protein [bacterium]
MLGITFVGGYGFALACLIPGIQDYRTGESQFFGGITERKHPRKYWIGTNAWFALALFFFVAALTGSAFAFPPW